MANSYEPILRGSFPLGYAQVDSDATITHIRVSAVGIALAQLLHAGMERSHLASTPGCSRTPFILNYFFSAGIQGIAGPWYCNTRHALLMYGEGITFAFIPDELDEFYVCHFPTCNLFFMPLQALAQRHSASVAGIRIIPNPALPDDPVKGRDRPEK